MRQIDIDIETFSPAPLESTEKLETRKPPPSRTGDVASRDVDITK